MKIAHTMENMAYKLENMESRLWGFRNYCYLCDVINFEYGGNNYPPLRVNVLIANEM